VLHVNILYAIYQFWAISAILGFGFFNAFIRWGYSNNIDLRDAANGFKTDPGIVMFRASVVSCILLGPLSLAICAIAPNDEQKYYLGWKNP
jgi:hypothetical protein